jgi:hypothetical protein
MKFSLIKSYYLGVLIRGLSLIFSNTATHCHLLSLAGKRIWLANDANRTMSFNILVYDDH